MTATRHFIRSTKRVVQIDRISQGKKNLLVFDDRSDKSKFCRKVSEANSDIQFVHDPGITSQLGGKSFDLQSI